MSARTRAGRTRPLHVLVVDDSAVVRMVLTQILSREPGMSVAAAADPHIAVNKIRACRPDVIVLDLEMPRMDGLTFLQHIMSKEPIPVVVCSSLVGPDSEAAVRAMEAGAIEVVAKPQLGVREFLEDSAVLLVDAVRGAAKAQLRKRGFPPREESTPLCAVQKGRRPGGPVRALATTTDKVVAIGASTGGTEALRYLLQAMPVDGPAMVIVQHMPEMFTAAFASRLDTQCEIEVKEAADGDRIYEGRALIAPGNRHTSVARSGAHYVARVHDGELVSRHRPSVDVLFRSVAQAAGSNALGVIMTGMGSDGAAGLLEMKQSGASTLAQNEKSCVVFGMPKEAIACGAADDVIDLSMIPRTILSWSRRGRL